MASRIPPKATQGRRCGIRFYRPAEFDGPGTISIFEFQCVLRSGHRGHHHVDLVS